MAHADSASASGWRVVAFVALSVVVLATPTPAPAYLTKSAGGNLVRWQAGSPAASWNDATKTLTWHYNAINSPQPNWPGQAATGAAFQNAFQTIQDTLGTSIRFSRGADVNQIPITNDNRVDMVMAPDETNDYWGQDISGAFALNMWSWNPANGVFSDMDVEMNGDVNSFTWSTSGPPAPAGTNDIELTACHEQLHGIGVGHSVYFYAMIWPAGRFPEDMMRDRCISPDDRVVIRTLYPSTPALSTISGTVTVAGGGACNLAVIVATDGNGVPQATQTTNGAGLYSINVPPGTNYSVTAHHYINTTYNSDINFASATDFVTSGTVTGINASANIGGVNFQVTNGGIGPDMTLVSLGHNGGPLGSQTLFLPKNSSGTIQLSIFATGPQLTTASIAAGSTNLGPGITVGAVTAAPSVAGRSTVNIPYTVAAGATPGVRNVTFAITGNSNERLFVPSYIEVVDTGGLTVAASAGNPVGGSAPLGTPDRPLLGVALTASAVEDVRIRRLQFGLAGSGSALPSVRLWIDNGTVGTLDGADVRVFSGGAYANTPVAEAIPGNVPGTVLFDNLALSVRAGQTVNLLLTSDFPAAGSGTYTASLDPSGGNMIAHGMFWGDVIVPAGGTVTGGTQNTGTLAIGGLTQIRTTGGTTIPVGGFTPELQVTLRGTPSAVAGLVGMDVEAQPIGQSFTGVPSGSAAATNPSGTVLSIVVSPLTNQTAYHWQARPVSSTTGPGAWVSFAANTETEVDFSVDNSTTAVPTALMQLESDGVTPVPLGGSASGAVVLSAINGTNSSGSQVRLEIEVQPLGVAFTNTPTVVSAFGPSGASAAATFSGPTNDYHWQARSTSAFGASSAWVAFNAAPLHFHLDAIEVIKAEAGCIGRTAAGGGGGILWAALGLALVAIAAGRRTARKAVGTLALVFCIGASAAAADDGFDLPRSLADEETLVVPLPEPAAAPSRSWLSLDARLGLLFMNLDFDAVRTDFVRREVDGMGTVVFGVEALFHLHPDWRVGLMAEVGLWSDVRIVGGGPVALWRFAANRENPDTRRSDVEHFARVSLLFQDLSVQKSNFGDFDATFGIRFGYEARIAVGRSWSVLLGIELQYSKWEYSSETLSGDDTAGGFGGLVTIGIAFLP